MSVVHTASALEECPYLCGTGHDQQHAFAGRSALAGARDAYRSGCASDSLARALGLCAARKVLVTTR